MSTHEACCALCAANGKCTQWAFHSKAQGRNPADTCHLHSASALRKAQPGTTSGVMNSTAL